MNARGSISQRGVPRKQCFSRKAGGVRTSTRRVAIEMYPPGPAPSVSVFVVGGLLFRPKKPGGVNTSARMRRGSGVNGAFLPYSRLVLCRWPVDGAGSCQMVSKTGVVAKAESAMYAIP